MKKVSLSIAYLLFLASWVDAQTIKTIIGNGTAGYSGDGISAINAELQGPISTRFDAAGNMYIADQGNNVIRKVSTTGIISTIVGNISTASLCGYTGDNGQATAAQICLPNDIAFDAAGNMYIAVGGNDVIRKVSTAGIITTIAGGGTLGLGNGGPATAAELNDPIGLAFDKAGNLYFSDNGNYQVRKIDKSGIITTIAGTGIAGFSGDNGPATAAQMGYPGDIAYSPAGELYIADYTHERIRKIDAAGIITTVAGGGTSMPGDGGPATAAVLGEMWAVLFDPAGNMFITDDNGYHIRKINTSGIITTIAGTGLAGYGGDGGPATNAKFDFQVNCSAVDAAGNLYIADFTNNRVRRITYNDVQVNEVKSTIANVSIYPNPAHTEITVCAGEQIDRVEIVSLIGQTIFQENYTGNTALILVGNLANGIYFVKVNGVYAGRFVKE